MDRRLTRLVVAVLLVFAVGGHWAILQSAAWIGMTITYSQADPLPVALKKTFDGNHPCQLCRTVSEGRAQENSPEVKVLISKIDGITGDGTIRVLPCLLDRAQPTFGAVPSHVADPPLTPPPIGA